MDIPFEGVKKRLQDLPLLGSDLFHSQFQDVMETEAKRIDTTKKLSLRKDSGNAGGRTIPRRTSQTWPSFRPETCKPFKP